MVNEGLFEYFTDKDLKIFNEELDDFLPKNIIDFHVHLWDKSFYEKNISEADKKYWPFIDPDVEEGFKIEDFKELVKKIFPNKNYGGLFFGFPSKGLDVEKNNEYISKLCLEENSFGLFMPNANLKFIPKDFFKKRFVGFKPYPNFVEGCQISNDLSVEVGIFEFISKAVLEFSEENGLIIIIHLGKTGRLNNKNNIEDLKVISIRYPNIKLVLAHAGRSYSYSYIKDSIEYIKDLKNIYVDDAMINSYLVHKTILEELGPERVLYGSDLPIAALKGKNVTINNDSYFITNKPKVYSLSSEKMNLVNFTLFIYEIIKSIKYASESLKLTKEDIENIFYFNAKNLIENIADKS